ncbi:hypothetical protein P3S68_012959 [Capsicum galapagoense]
MLEMYRAWASGMPSLSFSTIDPTSTLSFSPKLQCQFSVIGYVPQHAPESIPSQNNLNVSITHYLDLQYKSGTSIAPPIVSAFVALSSTEVSTLAFSPVIAPPQFASKSMFNTLDDHYYTPEPTSMLVRPSKFLTKKSDMTEDQEKMARKIKSTEKATKNSKGIANYEDVAYKYGDMSSSVNLSPSFEISKFEKHDGYKDSVKHLGRYCHQLRGTKGKKMENVPIVITGSKQISRGPTQQYCQFQSQACTSNSYAHMQLVEHTNSSELSFISTKRLLQEGMITPFLGHTINSRLRNFDPNARCPYHFDARGHTIEDCRALKREIERMIQEKLIVVQNIDTTSITQNPSSTHGNAQYVGNNELSMGIQN